MLLMLPNLHNPSCSLLILPIISSFSKFARNKNFGVYICLLHPSCVSPNGAPWLYIRSSASLRMAAVWRCFWNSDQLVLKLSICTSVSPRRQWSHWGLRVTQDGYFLLWTHTKQLLLVAFCDTLAGIEVSFWRDGTGTGRTEPDGQTDVEVEIVI